jgi:anti-sigma-K factor RskA
LGPALTKTGIKILGIKKRFILGYNKMSASQSISSRSLSPKSKLKSQEQSQKTMAIKKQKEKTKSMSLLSSSPAQIWRSRISWRIALAVFLTILAVQAIILNFTLRDFETARLNELKEV